MVERIGRVSYSSGAVNAVRGYTKEQAARIIEEVEKNSAEYLAAVEQLKQYSNPEHLSFEELLQQEMNPSEKKAVVENEEAEISREFGSEIAEAIDLTVSEESLKKSISKPGQIINLTT